jgi:hypothetical protein
MSAWHDFGHISTTCDEAIWRQSDRSESMDVVYDNLVDHVS